MFLALLGFVFSLAAGVCGLIIIVEAFQNEVWKGIVCFFCGLYLLYYAIVEYSSPNKGLILGIWLLGGIIGGVLINLSGFTQHAHSF
jgi:hypothetical protein